MPHGASELVPNGRVGETKFIRALSTSCPCIDARYETSGTMICAHNATRYIQIISYVNNKILCVDIHLQTWPAHQPRRHCTVNKNFLLKFLCDLRVSRGDIVLPNPRNTLVPLQPCLVLARLCLPRKSLFTQEIIVYQGYSRPASALPCPHVLVCTKKQF